MIENFPQQFKDKTTTCTEAEIGPRCEGIVAVCPPQGTGTTYAGEVTNYITTSNINMPVNVNTLTRLTNPRPPGDPAERKRERDAHPDLYPDSSVEAGHFPDATWSGSAVTTLGPISRVVNRFIGAQARDYPPGYRNRLFVPGSWQGGACMPSASPDGGA